MISWQTGVINMYFLVRICQQCVANAVNTAPSIPSPPRHINIKLLRLLECSSDGVKRCITTPLLYVTVVIGKPEMERCPISHSQVMKIFLWLGNL